MHRRCARCQQDLDPSAFNFKDRARGTLQSYCRACSRRSVREHYRSNTAYYIEKARTRNTAYRQQAHQAVLAYLKANPCVDCGESDPVVLDFDHLDGGNKTDNVSDLVKRRVTWAKIRREIEKCVVRCANCHRRRTAQQFGWHSILTL